MQQNEQATSSTEKKYFFLADIIIRMQHRLALLEVFFLFLDIAILVLAIFMTRLVLVKNITAAQPIEIVFVFCIIGVGLAINTYWMTFATRLHHKLKLRYFQARYLERKMNVADECIFTEEANFNIDNKVLDSHDKKEQILYPAALEGIIGSAKPQQLSWYVPSFIAIIYIVILVWSIALIA